MANRHDVIIWDADVYGLPSNFEQATNMASTLLEQSIATLSPKLKNYLLKMFAMKLQNQRMKTFKKFM
jgi:hypothetical protein